MNINEAPPWEADAQALVRSAGARALRSLPTPAAAIAAFRNAACRDLCELFLALRSVGDGFGRSRSGGFLHLEPGDAAAGDDRDAHSEAPQSLATISEALAADAYTGPHGSELFAADVRLAIESGRERIVQGSQLDPRVAMSDAQLLLDRFSALLTGRCVRHLFSHRLFSLLCIQAFCWPFCWPFCCPFCCPFTAFLVCGGCCLFLV